MIKIIKNNYIFITIIIVASVLRLFHLASIPISLNPDETAIGYNAYAILKTGLDEYGNVPIALKSFGDWKLPIYPFITMLPIIIFNLSEFSVRITSALAGISQVIIIYFIALKIFNKKSLALFSSLLLAFSPWAIYFSRMAYEVNLATAFFLAGFLSLIIYLENGNRNGKYLLLTAILFSITVFTYHAFIIFMPLFVFCVVIYLHKSFKKDIWTILSALLMFFIFTLSLYLATSVNKSKLTDVTIFSDRTVIFDRVEIFRTDGSNPNIFTTKILHNKYTGLGYHFAQNYLNTYSPSFLFDKGGEKLLHNLGTMGNFFLMDALLLIFGFVGVLKFGNNKRIPLLLIWIILAPIPSALTKDSPSSTRLFIMLPALIIIMAVGLDFIIEKIRKFSVIGRIALGFLAILYILNIVYFLDAYFIHMNYQRARYLHYGFKQMVEVSEKYKDHKVVVFGPENFPYISFLFYTKYDPNKFRNEVTYYPENYSNFVSVKSFGRYRFVDRLVMEELESNTIYFDYRGINGDDTTIDYPNGEYAFKYFFKGRR